SWTPRRTGTLIRERQSWGIASTPHLAKLAIGSLSWSAYRQKPAFSQPAPAEAWVVGDVGVDVAGRVAVPSAGVVSGFRWCASDGRTGRANEMGGAARTALESAFVEQARWGAGASGARILSRLQRRCGWSGWSGWPGWGSGRR